jgi:hypothetical protein
MKTPFFGTNNGGKEKVDFFFFLPIKGQKNDLQKKKVCVSHGRHLMYLYPQH